MAKAVILLLDSLGIGSSDDAHLFNDAGADTLGQVARWCEQVRQLPLNIPNLNKLGLGRAAFSSAGKILPGLDLSVSPIAYYGYAKEISTGKDSPAGHWELAGVPIVFNWGYLTDTTNSLSKAFIQEFCQKAQLPGILANCHSPGPEIVDQFGQDHVLTGKPICYSSIDSVLQIACHEQSFGLQHLYDICEIAREMLNKDNIARVIARPFTGELGQFKRTGNRHDFSMPPPKPTVLEYLHDAGIAVTGIGKVSDLFSGQGISTSLKVSGTQAQFDATLEAFQLADKIGDKDSLIFTNFGDFDSKFGHRRDVAGYANELEIFDQRLDELLNLLAPDDLLLVTADHGCDPTWQGTDHTREHVPVLCYCPKLGSKDIGKRETFADMGQSLASFFNVKALDIGRSFIGVC